ncbi:hypothetical protein [Streptomyces radiopugnans]
MIGDMNVPASRPVCPASAAAHVRGALRLVQQLLHAVGRPSGLAVGVAR